MSNHFVTSLGSVDVSKERTEPCSGEDKFSTEGKCLAGAQLEHSGNRGKMIRKLFTLTLVLVILSPNSCWAWGREGHQMIAMVAEDRLDQTTKVMIQSLLGNNHLYSIAPWADEIRRERPETKAWHYVNIPLGGRYDAQRDCTLPQSCISGQDP